MPKSILVVCVGNICRSPMAAALLESAMVGDVIVSSAGIGALVGEPAEDTAIELMTELDLDIKDHIARQLSEDLLKNSDLIVTMESGQVQWIEDRWPQSRGRVYRWGEWSDFDVPDPYRRGTSAFRESLKQIQNGLDDWVTRLRQIA